MSGFDSAAKQDAVEFKRLDARIAELESGIFKAVRKAEAKGMGDWPEFVMLRKLIEHADEKATR